MKFQIKQITTTKYLEITILISLFIIMGFINIPPHWTSIWMDHEFTGWIAPLSNRLADGGLLYTKGLHLPMAPLPIIFIYLISWGKAIWLLESLMIVLFQCAILFSLYKCLSILLKPPVPFLAVFSAIPIFFQLPKTVFNDPPVQLFIVLAIYLLSRLIELLQKNIYKHIYDLKIAIWPFLMGIAIASAILSKQSTGLGALVGTVLALILLPIQLGYKKLLGLLGIVLGGLIIGLLLWMAIISPFVSIPGMIQDVFIHGAQPKGDSDRILNYLMYFPIDSAHQMSLVRILLGIIMFIILIKPSFLIKDYAAIFYLNIRSLLTIIIIAFFSVLVRFWIYKPEPLSVGHFTDAGANLFLWSGYFTLFLLILNQIVHKFIHTKDHIKINILVPVCCVALFSAIFHNLSVSYIRWTYDNNPLIVIVLAIIFYFIISLPELSILNNKLLSKLSLGLIILVSSLCWLSFVPHLKLVTACTEKWPEIKQLHGARMRPHATGMRLVVQKIRSLTKPNEEVLLLPSDPNVETWFERPRPKLNTAMIFTDQYWDKYIEQDFNIISSKPPKVIIIGPRYSWPVHSRQWNKDKGADLFIQRVQKNLLPKYYKLDSIIEIGFANGTDYMDIFVLKNTK